MPISYLCCWIIQEKESRDWSWGKCSCKKCFRTILYKKTLAAQSHQQNWKLEKDAAQRKKRDQNFYLIDFVRDNLKSAGDFLKNQLSNFHVYRRKGTHKSALGISGRTQPLFLLYCVLGINYFILIISLHLSAMTFSFLQAFHQCENTAGDILLPFFRYSILFWKKYPSKGYFFFLWGDISKSKISGSVGWVIPWPFQDVLVTSISVCQMLIILQRKQLYIAAPLQ